MKSIVPLLSFAAAAAFLSGCGGGSDKSAASSEPAAASAPAAATTTSQAAATTTPSGARVINLTGDDTMHYNITEITASPGEALHVEMKNVGKMPKQTMSHNWVLVHPMADADIAKLSMSASTKAPTYMPPDMSAIIAHTKMCGPGESDSVEFKAPTEPGTYPYFCTFPGHFALMRGNLIVK